MFCKWNPQNLKRNVLKSSLRRKIQKAIVQQYPALESLITTLMPKKKKLEVGKAENHLQFYIIESTILFFRWRQGPFYPTLKLLHQIPSLLPIYYVDGGAVRPIMGGAQIMMKGLTKVPNGLPKESIPAQKVVAIVCIGKKNAFTIGLTEHSTEEIKLINNGPGIKNIHSINDGLWKFEIH
ncbi:mct-1 protein [Anaeramoeba flamelloides]|uniref:Mct-1 protein n=1 Tax=Anaeramoeba flamelloides TaxID=1746091 RepID=A0AAV7YTK6_9EUKA|nr:mct-1 protein [Anaeramoeba flamelloides]KAJ6246641.1 mct-1 protein [Anaeramoeba flamelloides]